MIQRRRNAGQIIVGDHIRANFSPDANGKAQRLRKLHPTLGGLAPGNIPSPADLYDRTDDAITLDEVERIAI